ncbi:MAG: TetR/AcrR family transcriptional regulator [Spirochaetales bacterium]|nr:TetR/AcrR family transcriptional regulator [Spirochaetales bacterium]MCF7939221.1 TetR/AcrR family transcriptional regulator [Spirochaetales bacterium]
MAKQTGKTVTKEKLILSALDLFSSRWYETVSIAEICRHAGLSNGIFYNYFNNKEKIFKELLDRYLVIFSDRLDEQVETSVEKELDRFLSGMIEDGKQNRQLVTVYREGQYRFPKYEKKLREICIHYFSRMYGREISEAEYIFLISGVRFVSMRSIYDKLEFRSDVLKKLILNGMFSEKIEHENAIFKEDFTALDSPDDNSRSRLIEAGIKLFGKRGFYNVNVYEVAKEAGFSVGTFYLYFPTKEDFVAEIVRTIGSRTRHFITINLDTSLNRAEQEVQGMYLFYNYFLQHKSYYSIVREAEFVVNEEVTEYYDKFEQGYQKSLSHVKSRNKKLVANALMGIAHYFGIESIFSRNVEDVRAALFDIGRMLSSGLPR